MSVEPHAYTEEGQPVFYPRTEDIPEPGSERHLAVHGGTSSFFRAPTVAAGKEMMVALLSARRDIKNPKRTGKNPYHGSGYAKLEDIIDEVTPVLLDNNLYMTQVFVDERGRESVLITSLLHLEGGSLVSSVRIPTFENPQKFTSFVTYTRRTMLCSILGIRDEDDDDGNTASFGLAQGTHVQAPSAAPAPPPMPMAPAAAPPPP